MTTATPAGVHPAARRRLRLRARPFTLLVTVATIAAAVAAADNFVLLPLRGQFGGAFEDFAAYVLGIHNIAAGRSPYVGFDASTVALSGFTYPPFAGIVLRPLALLSESTERLVWLWVALASLVAGAVITARALLPASWPRTRLAVLVALTFPPATYNLWHGQMNTVIFLLLALALRDYLGHRQVRCGVILGLAAGIKLAPIVLVVVLARCGWWRGALAGAAAAAATVAVGVAVLGWGVTDQYVTSVVPVLGRDNGWIYNQTWNGVVNRVGEHSVLTWGSTLWWPRVASTVLSLATVGVVLAAVSRRRRSRAATGAEFACGLLAMLLVGTLNWYPVYVDLLIPFAAALALAVERRREARRLVTMTTLTLVGVGVVAAAAIAVLTSRGIHAVAAGPWWWLFLQACSLPALLAAALLLVLARSLGASTAALSRAVRGVAPAR